MIDLDFPPSKWHLVCACFNEDPDIIPVPITKSNFEILIEDVIDDYINRFIQFYHPDDLFLYIETYILNGAYIGYDKAKKFFDDHIRIPLNDLLSRTLRKNRVKICANKKRIKEFVATNFPDSCFKQE